MCNSSIPAAYRVPAEEGLPDPHAPRRKDFPPAPEPLPVPVMDNHTHLDFPEGKGPAGIKAALDAAAAVGVQGAVQVGCDLESSRFTVEAVDQDERLLGAVALHPNDAPHYADRGELETALAEIERLAAHPRIRAIGETGLDFYRTHGEGLRHQEYSFRRHIDIAKRLDLTLQIHDRTRTATWCGCSRKRGHLTGWCSTASPETRTSQKPVTNRAGGCPLPAR